MSTARTTPAQKPRGRTRRSTFPLVSVGIFFLSQWFIKTLSYLRDGLSWMEIGGVAYIEERPASESRPYKTYGRGIGGESYGCGSGVWLRIAETARVNVSTTTSGL